MAVAFNAQSGGNFGFGAGVFATFSHNASGANRFVVVHIAFHGGSGSPQSTGVTYGGVAMTFGSSTLTGSIRNEYWYLIAPATGAQNVIVSYSGTPANAGAYAISFTGVHQTTPFTSAGTNSGTSSAATFSGPAGFVVPYGLWLIAFSTAGFGTFSANTLLSGTGAFIPAVNSGGASPFGLGLGPIYGTVAAPGTPTANSNSMGSSYTHVSNGLNLAEASTDVTVDIDTLAFNVSQINEDNETNDDIDTQTYAVTMNPLDSGSGGGTDVEINIDRMTVNVTMNPVVGFLDVPPIFPGGFTINVPTFRRRFIWPPKNLFG